MGFQVVSVLHTCAGEDETPASDHRSAVWCTAKLALLAPPTLITRSTSLTQTPLFDFRIRSGLFVHCLRICLRLLEL